jgi:hypothetical protein
LLQCAVVGVVGDEAASTALQTADDVTAEWAAIAIEFDGVGLQY